MDLDCSRILNRLVPLVLLAVSSNLSGELDSGGSPSSIGTFTNHGSIGSPIETVSISIGTYSSSSGQMEVIFMAAAVDPDEDADGNNLPDQWEIDNFGATGVDPDADADNDGTSNSMEFLAGTDPNDPSSVFRLSIYQDGDNLVMPIPTLIGRDYKIWGGSDLDTPTLLDTIVGDGTEVDVTYDSTAEDALPMFFKIEIIVSP